MSSRWTVGTGSPANSGTPHALSFDAPGAAPPATNLNPRGRSIPRPLARARSASSATPAARSTAAGRCTGARPIPSQVIDLHQFLPSEYISSYAVAINDAKTIAGTAIKSNGERYAVVWRPVHAFSFMFGHGFIRAGQITNAYVMLEKPAPKGGR